MLRPKKPMPDILVEDEISGNDESGDFIDPRIPFNRKILKNCRLGWCKKTGSLIVSYIKSLSYGQIDKKGGTKLILRRFAIKL